MGHLVRERNKPERESILECTAVYEMIVEAAVK